jgi:ferredoxin-NADP reductase
VIDAKSWYAPRAFGQSECLPKRIVLMVATCDARVTESMEIVQTLRPSPPMDCLATVVESRFLTPTIKSIRLHLNQPEFQFLPGQAIWPKFNRDGKQFSKIYSMSSSPSRCPEVELCVSRVGWSSAHIQDLAVGQTIEARGPYGLLTVDRLPSRPRLYLAEGSGIAPVKSQIDWLHEMNCPHPVWLIQANPETPDQLPYREHWHAFNQSWDKFHYREAIGQSPEMVLKAVLAELQAQGMVLADLDVDICAVNQRTLQLQHGAIALGAEPKSIRFETFHSF